MVQGIHHNSAINTIITDIYHGSYLPKVILELLINLPTTSFPPYTHPPPLSSLYSLLFCIAVHTLRSPLDTPLATEYEPYTHSSYHSPSFKRIAHMYLIQYSLFFYHLNKHSYNYNTSLSFPLQYPSLFLSNIPQ